jgi:hypothetical protein
VRRARSHRPSSRSSGSTGSAQDRSPRASAGRHQDAFAAPILRREDPATASTISPGSARRPAPS